METTKPWIKNLLQQVLATNDVTFVFEKADGSLRELTATTNLPQAEADRLAELSKDRDPAPKLADNCIRVFEKAIGEWRTVRIDRIQSVEIED